MAYFDYIPFYVWIILALAALMVNIPFLSGLKRVFGHNSRKNKISGDTSQSTLPKVVKQAPTPGLLHELPETGGEKEQQWIPVYGYRIRKQQSESVVYNYVIGFQPEQKDRFILTGTTSEGKPASESILLDDNNLEDIDFRFNGDLYLKSPAIGEGKLTITLPETTTDQTTDNHILRVNQTETVRVFKEFIKQNFIK